MSSMYGSGSAGGALAATGIGVTVAGQNVVLGGMIVGAVVLLAAGSVLYRIGSRGRRVDAAE